MKESKEIQNAVTVLLIGTVEGRYEISFSKASVSLLTCYDTTWKANLP